MTVTHTVVADYVALLNTNGDTAHDGLYPIVTDVDDAYPLNGSWRATEINEMAVSVYSDQAENDTFTVNLFGGVRGGAMERICSLECTVGSALAGTGLRWVDTIAVTSYHLGGGGVSVADVGSNTVCKVGFDAIGYRYLKAYTSGVTGNVVVLARHI